MNEFNSLERRASLYTMQGMQQATIHTAMFMELLAAQKLPFSHQTSPIGGAESVGSGVAGGFCDQVARLSHYGVRRPARFDEHRSNSNTSDTQSGPQTDVPRAGMGLYRH